MKNSLKKIPLLKDLAIFFRTLKRKNSLTSTLRALVAFFASYRKYVQLKSNGNIKVDHSDMYPRLFDDSVGTPVDPVYFHQNCWCASKIFGAKPREHVDVGSAYMLVGILAQFVKLIMVDIRPLPVEVKGLEFVKGDILHLPFKDRSVESLSSICVIEHIGLGRYGDPLDQFGSEKAATELSRVLGSGGSLYISVPVDRETKTYFNAHRAFTRDYLLSLFSDLNLVEEKYIYGNDLFDSYDPEKGFGTGMYHFKRSL